MKRLIFLYAALWSALVFYPKQTTAVFQVVHDYIARM